MIEILSRPPWSIILAVTALISVLALLWQELRAAQRVEAQRRIIQRLPSDLERRRAAWDEYWLYADSRCEVVREQGVGMTTTSTYTGCRGRTGTDGALYIERAEEPTEGKAGILTPGRTYVVLRAGQFKSFRNVPPA